MKEMKEYILKVGESAKIRSKIMGDTRIVYAGMPNPETYSIVVASTMGHNSVAYNLYFPLNQRRIEIKNRSFDVLDVSADGIRMIPVKKSVPSFG